jgi:cytochrome P450
VSERDPENHNNMRKFLSSAFSDRSLKEQEYLVAGVIDEFIEQVGKRVSEKDGINISSWFNLLTFDVIGELAFGESFNGVKSGKIG